MKGSTLLAIILVLQAVLVMGIFAAVAKENAVDESKQGVDNNTGTLRCCTNCNFSFSAQYTCDDVVPKCDPACKQCVPVCSTSGKKQFRCNDTFIGQCGPPC